MLITGQELVDFFAPSGEMAFKPTVVLLDLLMPRKSGLEAMAELSLGIPVIATTGNVTEDTMRQCRCVGVVGVGVGVVGVGVDVDVALWSYGNDGG